MDGRATKTFRRDVATKSNLPVGTSRGRTTKSLKVQNQRDVNDAFPEEPRPGHPRKSLPTTPKKAVNVSPIGKPVPRISSSQNAAPNPPTSLATRTSDMMQRKTNTVLSPIWRQLDDQAELERTRISKRDRNGNTLAKRISASSRRRPAPADYDTIRISVDDPNRSPALIAPPLRLTVEGRTLVDSDDDEPRYRPQQRLMHEKTQGPQVAVKRSAARKLEYYDTDSDFNGSDDEMKTASGQSSEEDVDQLDSDQYEPPQAGENITHENIKMTNAELDPQPSPIIIIDSPPVITAPLPKIDLVEERKPTILVEPSDALMSAFEAISLSPMRVHKTSQLPFLIRNLRRGFIHRCRELHVPIYPDNSEIDLQVFYEFIGGHVYQTEIDRWGCPMCDLLGTIRTREMLDCHLQWDHPEIYYEWQYMEYSETNSWILQLVIPEAHEVDSDPALNFERQETQSENRYQDQDERATTPTPRISLSRASSSRSTPEHLPTSKGPASPYRTKVEHIHIPGFRKVEPFAIDLSASPSRSSSLVPPTSRSQSAATSNTMSTTSMTSSRHLRPLDARYPTPPPPDNALGPAAQYPYLPAESDYGGPTILYSCRPGGPCLFDLLGTLPMDKYGLLDWEVLDREDEIYESDDIKEEYKVMHALWARWIFLNRNKFIDNHLKGVTSFIDDFWKIIHRAAGWDALRYFLFILLANQYLNGHEVANVLSHYEKYTGMEFWYQ